MVGPFFARLLVLRKRKKGTFTDFIGSLRRFYHNFEKLFTDFTTKNDENFEL